MSVVKDLIKLAVLLVLVTAIILGMHYLGTKEDMQKKYKHPITQPGAHW